MNNPFFSQIKNTFRDNIFKVSKNTKSCSSAKYKLEKYRSIHKNLLNIFLEITNLTKEIIEIIISYVLIYEEQILVQTGSLYKKIQNTIDLNNSKNIEIIQKPYYLQISINLIPPLTPERNCIWHFYSYHIINIFYRIKAISYVGKKDSNFVSWSPLILISQIKCGNLEDYVQSNHKQEFKTNLPKGKNHTVICNWTKNKNPQIKKEDWVDKFPHYLSLSNVVIIFPINEIFIELLKYFSSHIAELIIEYL